MRKISHTPPTLVGLKRSVEMNLEHQDGDAAGRGDGGGFLRGIKAEEEEEAAAEAYGSQHSACKVRVKLLKRLTFKGKT